MIDYFLTPLKIKNLSLGEEAKIIRKHETECLLERQNAKLRQKIDRANRADATWNSLYLHRKNKLRPEARASFLAYGFLRGVPYEVIERIVIKKNYYSNSGSTIDQNEELFWKRVAKIAWKFQPRTKTEDEVRKEVFAWRDQHPVYHALANKINSQPEVIKYYS